MLTDDTLSRYFECNYVECNYAECNYAECHVDCSINMIEIVLAGRNLGRVLNSRCGRTPTQYPQMNIIKMA